MSYLVADIGGTHGRFGCVRLDRTFTQIEHRKTLVNDDFKGLEELIAHYRSVVPRENFEGGCLAIACPVSGDAVQMTNRDWSFSVEELRRKLGFTRLEIMNDFAALACSLPYLEDADRMTVCAGTPQGGAPMLVLGPGTGLGAAALVFSQAGDPVVITTEAGHIGFAPGTPLEAAVIRSLLEDTRHVAVEDLISGRGMPVLHEVIAGLRGRSAGNLSARQISERALTERDETCLETLSVFCAALGSFAGDLALCFAARGGVFLSGGILGKLGAFLRGSDFALRFRSKGIMSKLLEDVPVFLVTSDTPALIGASYWYRRKSNLPLHPGGC